MTTAEERASGIYPEAARQAWLDGPSSPEVIPPQPAANPDPWMHYSSPLPVPGYPCPSCGQYVPPAWDHQSFEDD